MAWHLCFTLSPSAAAEKVESPLSIQPGRRASPKLLREMASGADERELCIPIPAGNASPAAAPELGLNRFVRFVALIERLGNALGTLAFTWATVVLLGGYSKDLDLEPDFWFATAIVFLEATRMFTRNNRLDYQVFFNTRGAFRPVGWNGLIAILCFFDILVILLKKDYLSDMGILLMAVILATGRFLSGLKLRICNPLRRATSLWSPLVAILLMAPPLSYRVTLYIYADDYDQYQMQDGIRGPSYHSQKIRGPSTSTRWIVFTALLVPVLLVTISRLRFPRIIRLVDSAVGSRQVFWRRVITNLCMVAALGIQVFMLHLDQSMNLSGVLIVQVGALAVVSFGNFQIPAAVVRIVLASLSLQHKYEGNEKNLETSLRIFYWMVLGQGTLYVVACMLEFFSFIPRRSLVHCGGFRGQWGVESVNLYYAYALEKCMQEGVLAPKKISLSTFAMDSLNSDSPRKQLNGIRTMHSFLHREQTKAQLYSELTISTKTMARIIRMLDWTGPKDTAIRLYAAKVTAELAKNIRVATFPGTMQLLSALLDADGQSKRGNPLLLTDDDQKEIQDPFLNVEDSQKQEHDAVRDVADNQGQRLDQLQDTNNLLETQNRSTEQACVNKQNYILRCWRRISEFRSIPKEQLSTDHDLLPALAMSIIESLAGCDQENCVEISNTSDLIPKVIGFTSYTNDMNTAHTKTQQKVLLKSSLKVLQRLTSISGEIGMRLRYKISKHPFLLTNLTDILGTNRSSQESIKLVAVILRNIAVDGIIGQEIGRIQLINTMLMQAFFNSEETTSTTATDVLQKVAGQALAILTTESAHNCLVMLKEPEFIKKLKNMILMHGGKNTYVAASLLRNLCLHTGHELRESDLKELSHVLREVLKRIIDAEGADLEILIGLSSQICKVIPEVFTRELEDGQIKLRFVKRLVDALNANMKPSAHCPGIRRVIIEQVIYLMECSSHYANCFRKCRMAEALLMVEQSVSKAENYRLFLGDAGFMEYSKPLSTIVARARELMGRD